MPTIQIIDDYTPRYVGDLSHPLLCNFFDHNTNAIVISGVNFAASTLTFKNRATGVSRRGTGAWAQVASPTNNVASYTWDALDVNTAGMFDIQATLQFVDGPLSFDTKPLEFLAHL